MASLGELFIELGVVGDTKELEKLNKKLKEVAKKADDFVKTIQEEIEYNEKLEEITKKVAEATQDLANAKTEEAKATAQSAIAAAEAQKKRLEELKAAKEAAKAAHNDVEVNQNAIDSKKEVAKNVAGVVKGIGVFVGAITGAAIAVNKFTNDLVQSNQALLDLTRTTDIAQGTFQKWGSIGKMLGVENADQQLASLNQRLFDLMLTGEGARGFQLAGINPMGQDAEGVLEQLRARVSGMNDTTATYLLQQMGIDPKMLYLLRIGRKEFEELGRTIEKYQLSRDDTKKIQAMNIQLQIAGIKLKYLKDKAIMAIMPAWNQFMASLARVVEGLSTAVKWVSDFISKSPALQSALKGIAAAMAIILAITQPLWAAFVALYLVIDDIVGYFQGKESTTGLLLGYLDDYIQELKDKFGDLSLDKVIPQVTLDVGEIIIKAGKVTLDNTPWGALLKYQQYNSLKNIDPNLLTPKQREMREKVLNSYEGQNGTATGGAAPIGYTGILPNLDNMFITPTMQRNLSYNTSNTTNTDNRTINMTNNIQTSQPVFDIQSQLAFARNAMNSGWA